MEQVTYKNIAVLIDADNTSYHIIGAALNSISLFGHISLKRAYGNWGKEELDEWKPIMKELAIRPMQQNDYVKNKNATDIALAIDAMDLLHSNTYDAFAVISSDSDFTPLVMRLREQGLFVIGVGKPEAATSLIQACDKFIVIDSKEEKLLAKSTKKPMAMNPVIEPDSPAAMIHKALEDVAGEYSRDDGFTLYSQVGEYLKRIIPDFDWKNYGFTSLSQFIRHFPNIYEVTTLEDNPTIYLYRRKE